MKEIFIGPFRYTFLILLGLTFTTPSWSAGAVGQTVDRKPNVNNEKRNPGLTSKSVNKDSRPTPDGAAVFKQLPIEIQGKIIAEVNEYSRTCGTDLLPYFYDCECAREEYISRRTLAGPDASGPSIYREAKNSCVNSKAIAEHEETKCLQQYKMQLKDYESYCKCFSETYARKFVAFPRLSFETMGMFHKDSFNECNYRSYRK